MCDVQLLDRYDLQSSRIHFCIFNLPGGILVVDGWSVSDTSVQLHGEEQPFCNDATRFLFLLPHGTPATLQVGSQRLLINPTDDGKSSPNDCAHGSVLKRLPGGNCTAAGPCCNARQRRHMMLTELVASLEQDAAQQ